MPMGVLDSAIFADMFGTPAMRAAFGDEAFLARCIEVEAALARAQGRLGIIPAAAAAAITQAERAVANGQVALAEPSMLERLATLVVEHAEALTSSNVILVGRGVPIVLSLQHSNGQVETFDTFYTT